MELIYSMRRKPMKCEPPHFERVTDPELVRPICTISCTNTIAFSSPTELSDTDCDTWGGHVYVCDLDTPWDSHRVVSTTHPVSALEWDGEGKHLLVATTEGEVSVFGQKDFLLNDWTRLYSTTFPGEHIVKGVFFHNGRRLVVVDKKPEAPIPEKIQALRPTPTLKGFGGVAIPGVCVISSTGLVGAITADSSSSACDSLRAHRDHVTHASFAHKNGNLVIAAVCVSGSGRVCVRCCVCVISSAPGVTLTPLPTLQTTTMPTSVTWCLREDTDSLLLAGSTLTLWKLSETQHHIHKLLSKGPLQGSTTPGGGQKPASDCFNTLVWQQTAVWGVEGGAWCTSVASSRLAVGAPHAVLATPRVLHVLHTETHHYICSRPVVTSGPEPAAASPPKKHKYGNTQPPPAAHAIVSCVEMSWLGGVVVAVDSRAQLHVYTLPQPWADIPSPLSVQHATTLLEYSIVSGYDALDVMLTFKHNVVEAVYERLTECFQRQPPAFQQYYFHTWLKTRIALCRLIPTAHSSVSWLTCLSTLWGLWSVCQSAIRHDDKPDEKPLAAFLDDHHADHDKALIALESKAELPAETQVLVALRRPLQRAVDIAVTALAAAAQHPSTQGHHGYELWADPVGISLVRKLVVLARGAGLGDMALSRLLARLHQPAKPELIEECSAVSALWAARVWEALPRAGVSAPHGKPPPHIMQYGSEPARVRVSPSPPPAADTAATPMDNIRYMYLGGGARWRGCCRCGARALPAPHPARHPLQRAHDARHLPRCRYMYLGGGARWRGCCRCGARALPAPHPARHPLQRAHDARHLPRCRCGGKWSLVSNI